MEFSWLYSVGAFVVFSVLGLASDAQTPAGLERLDRRDLVMGALCLALVVGFVAPALGTG